MKLFWLSSICVCRNNIDVCLSTTFVGCCMDLLFFLLPHLYTLSDFDKMFHNSQSNYNCVNKLYKSMTSNTVVCFKMNSRHLIFFYRLSGCKKSSDLLFSLWRSHVYDCQRYLLYFKKVCNYLIISDIITDIYDL